ncbi:MAG: hypothetical protein N2234_10310, partial [Planctomycetota bacterium]|nr:hypothetical protein [Planctomycetota bacterium]
VCSECEGAVLVQGGFPTRSAGIRSLAVAQRLLKEEFEKQFNIRFTIDTLTQKERDLLDRLMYTRYLLDEWRAEKEAPSNCAATKKEYADFCVSAETSGKVIVNLEIWGTFIGDAEIFKKRLVGLKAMKSEISKIFSDIPQDRIPYKFERQKILTTFLDSFKSK